MDFIPGGNPNSEARHGPLKGEWDMHWWVICYDGVTVMESVCIRQVLEWGVINCDPLQSHLELVDQMGRHSFYLQRLMKDKDVGVEGLWAIISNSSSDNGNIVAESSRLSVAFHIDCSSSVLQH